MNTTDPKYPKMKEGYEMFGQPTPWRIMILYALMYASFMSGVIFLLPDHDQLWFDAWWVNFLFFLTSTILLQFVLWRCMQYAYRRKDG